MHGNHPGDERLDPGGFETPFSERLDTLESSDSRGELGFDATGFVTEPAYARYEARTDSLESAVNAAETEAMESSEAEWLETEWLETPGDPQTESVESFAERLGRAWSAQRKGDPTPEALRAWLIQDHDDTMAGAKLRWRGRKVGADFWQRVSRAWMISREENMRFQPNFPGVAGLGPFAPPSAKAALVSDPIVEGSNVAPVAPLTLRFARELRQRYPGASVSNYRGHGGGAFLNRGYSLDIFIPGRDERGFFKKADAIRLLKAVHAAAGAVGAGWRVIYNDFAVADAINRQLGRRHVIFVGAASKNKAKVVTGLNWHGPDPLIVHLHLDLAPMGGANLDEAEAPMGETVSEAGCGCGGSRSASREEEWLDPSGEVQSFSDEQFDQFDPEDRMGEDRMGEDREDRETKRGRYDASEDEQFQDLDTENETNPLEAAGLSPAERKALEITSTLETGKRGGFYGLSGNFDGQGLSFGLVNWTIGTGSLQPLLRDFAREQPARWVAIFGGDAQSFLTLIIPKGDAATRTQHRFAIEEMNSKRIVNGRTIWSIREPWVGRFKKLSEDSAFQQIQIRYVRDLLARAAYFCRYFSLKSERAFAFMFDTVSSHGKWWLTRKIGGVEKRRQLIRERIAAGMPPEREFLLMLADVLGATVLPRWAEKARARKRWFVTGQHPRARELAGLEPDPNKPWTLSAGVERKESGESLDWLDFESPLGEDETENYAEPEVQGFDPQGFDSEGFDQFDQGEWQPSEAFLESVTEAAESIYSRFDETEDEAIPPLCLGYPPAYEKLIRQKGTKEGELLDRTSGDKTTNLSLQFRDYDVNAYIAGTKSAWGPGLERVTEFIRGRLIAGSAVEVTITGSASKTGTANFNQALSEKRAQCMAAFIKASLTDGEVAKIRFNERGDGFTNATCKGSDCELPGFRSVLVSVHAPNKPPPPVPPEVPGWDKYEIRCCAFQSLSLGEVIIDELLNKLPGGLPREIAEKLTPILKKKLEAALKRLLKRLPKLGRLVGDLSKLLKFLPIEVTRQKAIFQIRERGKPDPAITTLCYDGFGGRLALPIPGSLDDALDELLKKIPGIGSSDLARDALKKVIKEELEKILPERVRKTLSKLDSTVPGPWKPFDLNRKATLAVFAVDADIFVDIITGLSSPGRIMLGFDGGQWTLPDPARRIRLSCPDCSTSIIPVTVDGGSGVDLLSVNKGKLVPRGCECSEKASEAELFAFA